MSLRPRLYPDNLKTIFTAFNNGDMVLIITAGTSDTTHPVHFYIDNLAIREGWRYTTDCSQSNLASNGGVDGYRYTFNGQEQENELNPSITSAEFWMYDGRLGRRWNVDPVDQESISNYATFKNNPLSVVDINGDSPEWVETDNEMQYDNRVENQQDATELYGEGAIFRPNGYTYTASDGSCIELGDYGFFKENGEIQSSPDLAQTSLAYTNPAQALADAQSSIANVRLSYAAPLAIRMGQVADVATPEPSDLLPWKWVAHGVLFLGTAYYIEKMEGEIEGILRRSGGSQGYMYSLTANSTGPYPVLTWGNRLNTTTTLTAGDVWKFGETSSKNDRYSATEKARIGVGGVTENPLFYGNQVQIKIAEKLAIYEYFIRNGMLPPGNKIFR